MKRILWLLLLIGTAARALPPGIDSTNRQIRILLADKKFGDAARAYEHLGWLYQQQYGYNKYTVDAYFQCLKYFHLDGDSTDYYRLHHKLGDYYYLHDEFMQKHAVNYIRRAYLYFRRVGDLPRTIDCELALANIEQNSKPVPVSLITRLRKAERISARAGLAQSQAFALNLLSTTYLRFQRPDSARYFASASLAMSKKLGVNWLTGLNYFYLGITEQFRKNTAAALDYFRNSYRLATQENNISMMRQISRHTGESYADAGDFRNAYLSQLKALELATQFYQSEQTKSIRLQELDSQIKTLAVEKQLVAEQSQYQRFLNSMLVVGLILSVVGVGVLIYLRRQQKLIARQQAVIAQQQIHDLELKSLRAMIEGQESERSRIARDLHDGLGIQLSRIKLFVEAHQEQLPDGVREPLNQFLDEACTETRLISNDLRPYALSTFGLIPALEDLVQKLNLVNQTELVLEHYGEMPPLSEEASGMIFRVIQELLNNALKHAFARHITVQLLVNDETALISVDDDGRGGVPEEASGNGLANIRSRITYLGGQVMWQSEPGRGTSVMISLPMNRLVALNPSGRTA